MRYIILLLLFSIELVTIAQDVQFSQAEFSPLSLNPSLIGADKKLHAVLHHRDQWRGLNSYRTDEIFLGFRFNPSDFIKIKNQTAKFKTSEQKGFAMGFNVLTDKAGDGNMKNVSGHLALAYHLTLGENSKLSAGIVGGVEQKSVDPSGLRFNSQYGSTGIYDPASTSGEVFTSYKFNSPNVSAGLCYTFGQEGRSGSGEPDKLFNIGASFDHVYRKTGLYLTDKNNLNYVKYTFHAKALIGVGKSRYSMKASLSSSFQGPQYVILSGLFVKCRMSDASKYTGFRKDMAILLGCYYRYKDAFAPSVQYEFSIASIGISYDVNISSLSKATKGRGGLEITLRFFNPVSYLYQKK